MKAKTIPIPDKLIEEWSQLRTSSDFGQIADLADVFSQAVYRAFETKQCSPELFEIIADFYKGKQELIEKYLSDYND